MAGITQSKLCCKIFQELPLARIKHHAKFIAIAIAIDLTLVSQAYA
jgi:hypothetical protein